MALLSGMGNAFATTFSIITTKSNQLTLGTVPPRVPMLSSPIQVTSTKLPKTKCGLGIEWRFRNPQSAIRNQLLPASGVRRFIGPLGARVNRAFQHCLDHLALLIFDEGHVDVAVLEEELRFGHRQELHLRLQRNLHEERIALARDGGEDVRTDFVFACV